jgi:uncharacterized integral membrane protein
LGARVKHISWILTIPLTALLVAFAVANRAFVDIDLWPFEFKLPLPIFVLVLGSLVIGFFIGAAVAWLSIAKHRHRARVARKDVTKLEREVARLEREAERRSGQTALATPVSTGPTASLAPPGRDPGRPAA